ncbi:MAG: hypothetical protein RQ990_04870 [Candidatus Hydrothermia bacterium]|nr:hypothetical protein [Candidatus Hydrothermia bacterium]
MKNPFYEKEFIEKLADFSEGKVEFFEPIAIISKGILIKRGYSLTYGFYGGFKDSIDKNFLKSISRNFFKFYIYDFENRINVDFLKNKTVFTYLLEVPQSIEIFFKMISKNRYKSLKKLQNKEKKLNLTIKEGLNFFEKFYENYRTLYKKHHKVFKKENILKLKNYLNLLNVLQNDNYLGGVLIIKINNYALLWISGYRKLLNFDIGEFLFLISVRWAIENKLELLDFGLETTESVGFIKSSFGTKKYEYNVWFK